MKLYGERDMKEEKVVAKIEETRYFKVLNCGRSCHGGNAAWAAERQWQTARLMAYIKEVA